MTPVVLTPGPLTAALAARAVVAAAAEYGFAPETVHLPIRDGRGRARLLAAAGLVHPHDRPAAQCAKLMGVGCVQMSPSGLVARGVTAEAVARVHTALAQAAARGEFAAAPDLSIKARARRGEPGWVDPRRDLAREKRILDARRAGDGPREIARREGMSLTTTKGLLARLAAESGEVYPEVKPGPRRGGRPARPQGGPPQKVRVPRPAKAPGLDPAPAKPRGRPRKVQNAEAAAVASPAEPKSFAAATPEAPAAPVDPFPKDHPAWTPLPGAEPARLIDHRTGCRWPVEIEGRREPMVCNAPTHPSGTYCGRHLWLSLGPAGRARLAEFAPPPASPPRMARPAGAAELKDLFE